MKTAPPVHTAPDQRNEEKRRMSPLWLTLWAGADKALPMIYGVAIILIPLRVLDAEQWGIWTVFQMIFMVISLLGDFFILQPMVKLCAEHDTDERPIVTASSVLYTLFSILLTLPALLIPDILANILKVPPGGIIAFQFMGWMILSTIIRNISIRVLQVDYRIIGIFVVDVVYFGGVIGLMTYGMVSGTFTTAQDLINYNFYALWGSSAIGLLLCFRALLPSLYHFGASAKRVLQLGIHQGGTGLLTVVQQHGDLAIVSAVSGSVAVGIYNAAKIFYRFFEAIRDATQLLLVPVTSRTYSQEKTESVQEITEIATAAMVVLMFPLSIVLILFAPVIIPIVLPKFPEAVEEFQWLMAAGFAMPFIIVPSAVLLGIGHTRDLFRGTLIGTVTLVIAGLFLTYFFQTVGMAAGVLIGVTATAILLTRRMNYYVHFTFRSVLRRSRSFVPIMCKHLAGMQLSLRKKG